MPMNLSDKAWLYAALNFFGIILLHGIMEPLSGIPQASAHGGEKENQDAYLSGWAEFEGK